MKKGFTLIELLIVIAILGVLAVVVLVAINPQEQLARTRDAGRISSVAQIGHALQAYATAHEGEYPDPAIAVNCTASTDWLNCLVDAGELAQAPTGPAYAITTTLCNTNVEPDGNSWCYVVSGTDAIVYGALESGSNKTRCGTDDAWTVFDTSQGRGGIVCDTNEPAGPGVVFVN